MILMTSLKYYNSIILFMMIIVIYLFSHLISFCYASQIKSGTTRHHTLDLSQHGQLGRCIKSSSTTNIPAPPGKGSETAVFEVFHKHRLCADGATSSSSPPSADEILRRDQLRVQNIRHKIMNRKLHYDDNSAPVEAGDILDYGGGYVVRIGLGTPTRNLHLILDTGSHITWTQCRPCLWNCYKQRDQTFDPRKSTTYSNISCTDHIECPQSDFRCYKNRTCEYRVGYGDKSYTVGFLVKDKLTLTKNDSFPNFMFGCGQNNTGSYGKTAGILGLGRGRQSVVSQTVQKFGGYFSYFLPSNPNSSGHLSFGRNINNTRDDVKFTSLIYDPRINPYLYFIKITSITVGCKRLPIPPSVFNNDKNVIDSGTTITVLPEKAYIAMRDEFKNQMKNTKRAPPVEIMDTCFYVHKDKTIEFPTIKFTFEGDVTVEVGRFGIFYVVNSSVACFAFAGNDGEKDSISIFGEMVQQNMEVVYDVVGGKLGFGVLTG